MRRLHVCAIALLLLVVFGCDTAVDRFQENEKHYSIFGYLNASADTQFVRVEPLRDSMLTRAPETLDVEVTLTNLSTDRTVSLRDSVFRSPGPVHNFYTTVDIDPNTTYRLRVAGPEDAESHAETTVPRSFAAPTVVEPVRDCFPQCRVVGPPDCGVDGAESRISVVLVEDVERLVAVKAILDMERPSGTWTFGHLADTVRAQEGVVNARVDYGRDWCKIPPPLYQGRMQETISVVVAAGGPDWPEFTEMDQPSGMLPEGGSNVVGGMGYLGGIVTDTVTLYPYDD